jgi:integrase/recombinase XerD
MGLGKQAKVLSKSQFDALLFHVSKRRHPTRNRVIAMLSVKAGLRAIEIAKLTWAMVLDADGTISNDIALQDCASKGASGRNIPIAKELRVALSLLKAECGEIDRHERVVQTARTKDVSAQVIINIFHFWYRDLGLMGCSSHSGRRTFITNAARKISSVGGSLRDVQSLAGHAALTTTQRYIEINSAAKRRVVEII